MKYQDLKAGIRSHLEDAAEDFFMVGYFLRQISENALFTEDGYKSIWEFAKGEYGLSTSSASRFMAINARFSIDGGEHMAEKYIGMGVSKLQEMLGLPDEELEKVTQETTVREIRAMKKRQEAPRSFYGFPKTERPEGSLLTTPGCGDGKYDCFSCARPCGIRQEERYCRDAPLGNPFFCTQMSEEKRLDIEAGLFSEKCQHLHPELAPIREGDKEPTPCCLTCEHKTCYSRCDVAKKKDEDEKKKAQEELQKQQREAEEPGKPEIIDGDFREVEDEPMDDPAQEAAKTRDERQEPEPVLCDTCEHEGECAGKKTHENGCMGYEEKAQELEAEAEPNPEEYARFDVESILKKEKGYLDGGREADCPAKFIKEHKILVDALTLLLEKMDAEGGAED
ncbi:hypothetical protein AALB81_12305 [Lachnospiraceae bacterium 48-33]